MANIHNPKPCKNTKLTAEHAAQGLEVLKGQGKRDAIEIQNLRAENKRLKAALRAIRAEIGIITLTKHPQHLDSTSPPCDLGQAGAPEVTAEMIDAGVAALSPFYGADDASSHFARRAVEEVFRAMVACVDPAQARR